MQEFNFRKIAKLKNELESIPKDYGIISIKGPWVHIEPKKLFEIFEAQKIRITEAVPGRDLFYTATAWHKDTMYRAYMTSDEWKEVQKNVLMR